MIIEFVGTSGGGKSTLWRLVHEKLLQDRVNARLPLELLVGRRITELINNERIQNLILDFCLLPWTLLSFILLPEFIRYCWRTMRRNAGLSATIIFFRNILRMIGIQVFLHRPYIKKRIVLVNEGTIHIAHKIFALGRQPISSAEIAEFLRLAPKPDMVVYVFADNAALIRRTLARRDKPSRAPPERNS